MPISIAEALASQEEGAIVKARDTRSSSLPRYLLSACMAGAFVGVAFVLMLMVSTAFIAQTSPATKLVQGAVFGIALTLVVFAGAELFTGTIMTMVQGVMKRVVSPAEALIVWVAALVGNLVGSLAFSALVAASGIVNAAPKGKVNPVADALAGIVQAKVNLTGNQLFFRAVLCNFLVCLALWMASRTKSDAAKLICLWWALFAFVASGFEHSVANMTVFGIAMFVHTVNPQTHANLGTVHNLFSNLAVTVPGNLVGGGLLVGAVYGLIGSGERKAGERQTLDLTETNGNHAVADVEPVATPLARPARARATTAPPRRRVSP